ncbi:hypothetical protein A3862_20845 [Methylobacterium sp. XJLW]|uniref:hypothetical protein n=1 Tax=Methylobacterium sp. XJLW TaxID=739141 RepID=UPI000DAB0FA1|nr:hypothetical protein [Methylobacterium sp. XJLW]AWV17645.1 hypothetical protein A3862_20845 [Methylobacterium sp. XJLW]
MDEIITGTVTGIASTALGDVATNPTGREIWTGVKIRTADGKSRFFPSMLVEAEASLIINEAMDRGEPVELWLSGKDIRAYPYGVRTARETWYGDIFGPYLRNQGFKWLALGILLLPLLGLGVLFILSAVGYFFSAATFGARRSRQTFETGLGDASVLGDNGRLRAA